MLLVDVNKKTRTTNMTPLGLALKKCCNYLGEDPPKETYQKYHGIVVTLMKSDDIIDGVDENVLGFAVNFPAILKNILEHRPQYYQSGSDQSPLVRAINRGLYNKATGFIELVLRQSADGIVMDLIDKDSEFLKKYRNDDGETPLHTAAKLGNVVIVKRLMDCG